MQRFLLNLLTDDLPTSKSFYCRLLDMDVKFTSDWFVNLGFKSNEGAEIGLIDADHDIAPKSINRIPGGSYATIVVEDIQPIHDRAIDMGAEIIEPPTDMFYGQSRMLVRDPSGHILDISAVS